MFATKEPDLQEIVRRLERCEHRQRAVGGLLLATIVGCAIFSTRTPAISQTPLQLQAEIAELQNKLKFVTTTGTDMIISGANLHIVNGNGATENENGLGNLIVGYNEERNDSPSTDVRTGSHNLILGDYNSYSSYGGIISGRHNTLTGAYSCVQGSFGSTVSGSYASVNGGNGNIASGAYSFLGGGEANSASGLGATITGGQANVASAHVSSVSGGNGNVASGEYANIGGGRGNKASGTYSYVCAGQSNAASGSASTITGGYNNKALASDSAIVGGISNAASGGYSVVLGGKTNSTTAMYDVVPLSSDISTINTSITGINTSIAGVNTAITKIKTSQSHDESNILLLQGANTTINNNISALQSLTRYITTGIDLNGFPAMFVTGCNVWVQDGSGSTSDGGAALTGLGNLIIGYNASSLGTNPRGDIRTGSHNLIVGDGNTYTSYGGVVFGYGNSSLAASATVTGGAFNTASGGDSSVSGGSYSTAATFYDSVSGGYVNMANGGNSSVSGGEGNMATTFGSSVQGGYENQANGYEASVVGGFRNIVNNDPSTPFGDFSYAALLGGINITLSTEYGTWPLAP
jgi:hypothetical protein